MANKLNQVTCFNDQLNVGKVGCVFEPGIPIGSILIPKGKILTQAELAIIKTTLAALYVNDSKALRAYPIGIYDEVAGKGKDRVTQEFKSTGRTRTVRRSRQARQYTIAGAGFNYFKAVLSFSGKHNSYDELIFDDAYQLRGRTATASDGKAGLGGYSLGDLYVSDFQDPDGSTGEQFMIDVDYNDTTEHNQNMGFLKLEFNPISDLQLLVDVLLTNETPSPGTTNHIIIGTTYGGGNDLTATFLSTLAVTGAWDVRNSATNASLTVSAVALVPGVGYDLTITTGTGITATVKLKAPSVLAALTPPILGLESNTLTGVLIP